MSKRGRNLAALAALGALGYGYMARGDKQEGKDVPVDTRENSASAPPVATAPTPAAASAAVAAPSKESHHASEGRRDTPVASLEGNRGASLLGGRIVSKEELAKSGLSLRDFLNKERGLTRRGPSTPGEQAPVDSTRSMDPAREDTTTLARETARARRATEAAASPARSAAPAASAAQAAPAASAASRAASVEAPAASASRSASSGLTLGTPTRPAPKAPSIYAGPEAWAEYRKQQTAGMKKGGAVKKMASGGSTSGASRRGDGIAQRGKTKGRMY